jgi:hypothetical protein
MESDMSKIDLHNEVAAISAAYAKSDNPEKKLLKMLRKLQVKILAFNPKPQSDGA